MAQWWSQSEHPRQEIKPSWPCSILLPIHLLTSLSLLTKAITTLPLVIITPFLHNFTPSACVTASFIPAFPILYKWNHITSFLCLASLAQQCICEICPHCSVQLWVINFLWFTVFCCMNLSQFLTIPLLMDVCAVSCFWLLQIMPSWTTLCVCTRFWWLCA